MVLLTSSVRQNEHHPPHPSSHRSQRNTETKERSEFVGIELIVFVRTHRCLRSSFHTKVAHGLRLHQPTDVLPHIKRLRSGTIVFSSLRRLSKCIFQIYYDEVCLNYTENLSSPSLCGRSSLFGCGGSERARKPHGNSKLWLIFWKVCHKVYISLLFIAFILLKVN